MSPTRTPRVRLFYYMAGRVSGPAGNIRYKNSGCVMLSAQRIDICICSLRFVEGLPFDRPQYPWLWCINASRGYPVLWLIPRFSWGRDVYPGARQSLASNCDWASQRSSGFSSDD